jgi:M6 family metalloprotease-like protein
VFGWYPVPKPGAFYYAGDNGLATDADSGEAGAFIRHTLDAADATVDFRPYDNDGPDGLPNSGDDDGVVDLVMFVHPNEGGECGGADIWSHSFSYSGWGQHHGQKYVTQDIGYNGQPLKVDDYTIMPALACGGGRRIEVGVFSHEFGHALGLPDLYDRTSPDGQGLVRTGGMGLFCLMAAGSYGGDYAHAETPTQMCAWSKENLGWIQPHEIVCDETFPLYYQGDAPEAVKLWKGGDYSTHEWFLVENRQKKKWDRYLRGSGLLVTHVDDKVTTQNDEACPGGLPCPTSHPQVMVVEADNQWEMQAEAPPVNGSWYGEGEDFFFAGGKDSLTDLSLPSSRDYSGMLTGVRVTGIGPSADKMMASFGVTQACAAAPSLSLASARVTGGCDLDPFVDAGEKVSVAVRIRNAPTGAKATGVTGTLVSLSPALSVVGGAQSFPDLDHGKFGDVIVPFQVQATGAPSCSTSASLRLDLAAAGGYTVSQTFAVRMGLDSLYIAYPTFADDMETSDNGWSHFAEVNDDDWSRNTNGNHTTGAIPGRSWFTAAPATGKDVSLVAPSFTPSASSVVSYWHRYDTEDNWDGYVLELSTDGGASWIDVGDATNIGYDDAVTVNPQSTISGRRCWNGLSPSFPAFEQVTLPVGAYAGQHCLLRFRMATDLSTTGTTPLAGVNIDDFSVTGAGVLRERCETTLVCGGAETTPPVFGGLTEATNPGTAACDAVDLKWAAATDASGPVTYLVYASTTTPVPTVAPVASTPLLRYRVGGLTPNQAYHFLVRARDSQGNVDANTNEQAVTLNCDPPNLVVQSWKLVETAGCDGDNRPDAGETLNLLVTVKNTGATNALGALARVTSPDPSKAQVITDAQGLGNLNVQHYEERAFAVTVPSGVACTTPLTLTVRLTAAGGYAADRTIDLVLESDQALQSMTFFDDVEGTSPNGFSHGADSGADDWAYVTSDAFSPTHSWFASDASGVKNAFLVSPPLYVSPSSVLSFRHRYVLESGFDGAVLEASNDGGATWTDIGTGYNSSAAPVAPVFESPFLPGKAFWSGNSNGFVAASVNVGTLTDAAQQPLLAGKVAQFRWRIGCDNDNTTAPYVGWWIDDIRLTDSGTFQVACDATPSCHVVAVGDPAVPAQSRLEAALPNPARSSTVLRYQLAAADAGVVTLRIYDVNGRVVKELANGYRVAGAYQATWDRTDSRGARVAGGVYFAQLAVHGQRMGQKVVVAD